MIHLFLFSFPFVAEAWSEQRPHRWRNLGYVLSATGEELFGDWDFLCLVSWVSGTWDRLLFSSVFGAFSAPSCSGTMLHHWPLKRNQFPSMNAAVWPASLMTQGRFPEKRLNWLQRSRITSSPVTSRLLHMSKHNSTVDELTLTDLVAILSIHKISWSSPGSFQLVWWP